MSFGLSFLNRAVSLEFFQSDGTGRKQQQRKNGWATFLLSTQSSPSTLMLLFSCFLKGESFLTIFHYDYVPGALIIYPMRIIAISSLDFLLLSFLHLRLRNALLNITKYMSSTGIIRDFGRLWEIVHTHLQPLMWIESVLCQLSATFFSGL